MGEGMGMLTRPGERNQPNLRKGTLNPSWGRETSSHPGERNHQLILGEGTLIPSWGKEPSQPGGRNLHPMLGEGNLIPTWGKEPSAHSWERIQPILGKGTPCAFADPNPSWGQAVLGLGFSHLCVQG